jgi:hypothetical protein
MPLEQNKSGRAIDPHHPRGNPRNPGLFARFTRPDRNNER